MHLVHLAKQTTLKDYSVSEMKWEEGKELFKEVPKKSSLGKGKKKVKMKRKAKGYKTSLNSEEAIF